MKSMAKPKRKGSDFAIQRNIDIIKYDKQFLFSR